MYLVMEEWNMKMRMSMEAINFSLTREVLLLTNLTTPQNPAQQTSSTSGDAAYIRSFW